MTDNKNRTASKIRTILQKNGGRLGENGSTSHLFYNCGVIQFQKELIEDDHALELAKKNIPNGKFYKENITKLPFEDSSVDFVFTHKLLNYLDDDTLDNGVSEMFRVAKKYIVNCELFGESEEMINDEMKFRNMQKRWLNYKVKIVSNVNMHEEIEPEQVRFTLLRKVQ